MAEFYNEKQTKEREKKIKYKVWARTKEYQKRNLFAHTTIIHAYINKHYYDSYILYAYRSIVNIKFGSSLTQHGAYLHNT